MLASYLVVVPGNGGVLSIGKSYLAVVGPPLVRQIWVLWELWILKERHDAIL